MKRIVLAITLAVAHFAMVGQERNGFAIVVDADSYRLCASELEKYRESVSKDGLNAFIVQAKWESPDQVKDSLLAYRISARLEGAVFVGDIPIPMIRKAQHLTSAFKMDEDAWDFRDSSVPSDRFYDDFDLKFRYAGRDSAETSFFYYELAPDSPQYIECDIYSGRIKPSSSRQDKYEELKGYLNKIVRIKAESNSLDNVVSYTGDGSFSNSLIAWKDESVTLREQLPEAFGKDREAGFYIFAMQPFMKETMTEQIRRDDLDLIFFHEHGMPERQYLTGIPAATGQEEYYEAAKRAAREAVRTKIRYGMDRNEAKRFVMDKFGLDSTWVADTFEPETVRKDSLSDLMTGIVLDDIAATAPNVRMAVFDACYNGDFREADCIASRYIMSEGNTVVTVGNSVNVLQDKSSSDLIGMLACGYRVGEWMQMTNILESHIMGDPTFRFASSCSFAVPDIRNDDIDYWKRYTADIYPCDIRGLALHKLFNLRYDGLSDALLKTYMDADEYMLRLQCMHLLAYYYDGNYEKLLKAAADDPYEFIRRKAAFYMGKVGSNELAETLASMYLNEYNAKRVAFNIGFAAGHFEKDVIEKAFAEAIEDADFIFDKERFAGQVQKQTNTAISIMESTRKDLSDISGNGRNFYLSGMRNNPYPQLAGLLVDIVKDSSRSLETRTDAAEVLGWYSRAWNRKMIVDELSAYSCQDMPEQLRDEITKTVNRLERYMR